MVSIESLDLSAENTNTYRLKDAKRLGVYQSTRRWRTKQVFLTGRGKECGNVFCVVCFLEIQDVENQTILTVDIIFRSGTNKQSKTHTHTLWGLLGFTIPSSMRNGNRNLQRKVPTTFCEKLHRAIFSQIAARHHLDAVAAAMGGHLWANGFLRLAECQRPLLLVTEFEILISHFGLKRSEKVQRIEAESATHVPAVTISQQRTPRRY